MFEVSSKQSESFNFENQVSKILDEIIAIGGVDNVILASNEGFPMVSRQAPPMNTEDELLVAAMLSGLMATVTGAAKRLGRSECQLVTVESDDGYIVVCSTINGAVLAVTTCSSHLRWRCGAAT